MALATTARIRRIVREVEIAVASDASVRTVYPDARPQGREDNVQDSFFDLTSNAQAFVNERFAVLKTARLIEAAECDSDLGIGSTIAVAPLLPTIRMQDRMRPLDRVMKLKGVAFDLNTQTNAIEAIG